MGIIRRILDAEANASSILSFARHSITGQIRTAPQPVRGLCGQLWAQAPGPEFEQIHPAREERKPEPEGTGAVTEPGGNPGPRVGRSPWGCSPSLTDC